MKRLMLLVLVIAAILPWVFNPVDQVQADKAQVVVGTSINTVTTGSAMFSPPSGWYGNIALGFKALAACQGTAYTAKIWTTNNATDWVLFATVTDSVSYYADLEVPCVLSWPLGGPIGVKVSLTAVEEADSLVSCTPYLTLIK